MKLIIFATRTHARTHTHTRRTDISIDSLYNLSMFSAERRIPATSVYFDYNESDNPKWQKLEALIIVSNKKSLPVNFKPCIQCFTNRTQNSTNPIAVVEGNVSTLCFSHTKGF